MNRYVLNTLINLLIFVIGGFDERYAYFFKILFRVVVDSGKCYFLYHFLFERWSVWCAGSCGDINREYRRVTFHCSHRMYQIIVMFTWCLCFYANLSCWYRTSLHRSFVGCAGVVCLLHSGSCFKPRPGCWFRLLSCCSTDSIFG